jgi:hypothetical protein
MTQIKQRINLLSESQIRELYNAPNFTKQDMELFFSLSESDYLQLNHYKTTKFHNSTWTF